MKVSIPPPSPVALELSSEEASLLLQLAGNITDTNNPRELAIQAFNNEDKTRRIRLLAGDLYTNLYRAGVR